MGWEPPLFFASGPNGVPLDDLTLSFGEAGFLVLMIGLAGAPAQAGKEYVASFKIMNRIALFLTWIFGFLGVVASGIYIEFNEVFYGTGSPPAPGAFNDRIFIRAHLLYAFLFLPITFSILLAVEARHNQKRGIPGPWLNIFALTSIFGMLLGLVGEFMWITILDKSLFFGGIVLMAVGVVGGAINLRPHAKRNL